VFGLNAGLDNSLITSILLAGCCWPWKAITSGAALSFETWNEDGRCKMYWRSVVLPMTDVEDIVTFVIDLPGESPEGKVLPHPALAASETGQRTLKINEVVRIAAMEKGKARKGVVLRTTLS
jgi:hypothetical protein